ncbi:MAG: hypothetical protein Q8Q74_16910, partial [Polaromonas sp.]|nr:hypothetical protein [Polaromonas sp.]
GWRGRTGTKIHSVSGDCERPGLYEYPFGTRIGRILEDCEFDRRIAFEVVPSAGAFMVFDRSRDMFEVARNFAHFFAHERPAGRA